MLLNSYLTYFQMKMVDTASLVQKNEIEKEKMNAADQTQAGGGNILNFI